MGKGSGMLKGGFLRLFQTLLYILPFLCACAILGIFSYFLAFEHDRHEHIPTWEKAVEGLAGVTVLYTLIAMLLTCCLGGVTIFAILGLILDLLFCGAMIAIAVMCRNGASKCKGHVKTPLGNGQANDHIGGTNHASTVTTHVKYKTACELNTVVFALAIIAAFLFLITALMQLALMRHHKKEKRYGPSPDNNYTSGSGKKQSKWGRKEKEHHAEEAAGAGAVGGAGLAAAHHHDTRASHETGYTGNTAVGNGTNSYDKTDGTTGHNLSTRNDLTTPANGTHGGYYTQPQGTGVNPYGYENQATQYGTANTTGTATNY